jgi:acylphosphatase
MERLEATIYGRVQGVMYRDFVTKKAGSLTGEVKNCSDGTVCVIAEGERSLLEKLLAHLHKGSLFSKVEKVEAVWKPASNNYSSFAITYE